MFLKPCEGSITSGYGQRDGKLHPGIDIGGNYGTPIKAAADGTIVLAQGGCVEGNKTCNGGYGNHIKIKHYINGKDYETLYAHMQSLAKTSGTVYKGEVIGYMGNTGDSTGVHLHFELHQPNWTSDKRYSLNPVDYFSNESGDKIMLSIGSNGEYVKLVHYQLWALGYIQGDAKERDIYDQFTADKIKQFQTDQKLRYINGVYDYATASAFAAVLAVYHKHWINCPNK